ncbi:MAG: ABC transporter permease [Lachnospiraceae bacterium]|nr:ABC transporter permease [Lachnospiraceae bacterium]
MYRYFFIAKNNMKKQKGDMITFFIMTFLSAFMIFTCINMLVGTFRVVSTNRKAINSADVLVLISDEPVQIFKLEEMIQGNENLDGYEENKYLNGMAKWRKKGEKSWADYPFAMASYEEERKIHTASLDTSKFSGKDIVIPVSLSNTFSVGDGMELKFGDNVYEFRVAGFNEDFIYSSPMNMGTYLVYISEKMYTEIEFENRGFVSTSKLVKSKLSQKAVKEGVSMDAEADNLYNELNTWYQNYQAAHPEYTADLNTNFIPSDMMAIAGMILPFIFIAIILVFAFVILAVALVVIDFSVKNFIMDNMKNTGIMEAGGYTVKEMMFILLVQLLTVSLAGSFMGVLVAALLQGKIGFIMLYLIGLTWNQGPDIAVFIGVIIGICLLVTVFALVLGRQYKKTTVLEALRGGINTHNYKKNVFSFEKTNLPITITLALKETFGKFSKQIGVILIMAILAFSAAMGFGIYENMGKDVNALLVISGIDLYDADFIGEAGMGETVASFECVKETHYEFWTGLDYQKGRKTKSISTRVISDPSLMNPKQMVEGRWPLYENEVAVGTSVANNLGVKVGDIITVKNGEQEATYLVTGLMQTFNNMGMMGYISKAGYERIGTSPNRYTHTVYLKDGYTFDDLEKEFKDIYPDTDLTDELASTGGLFPMLKASMSLILIIIMLITAFVVALAEALLIRTRITKEWRNLGVNKALGFTSNQLIGQIILSNIPAIIIGIVLGLIAVTFFGDKLVILMFAIFGFRKVDFILSPIAYLSVVLVIIGVALLVGWLNGKRIRKLEPVRMITEE